ncbi:MAG TPA: hypothetical protein PLM29_07800 [Deltaproteobacteria bacterium]|nr:hypothetical protein [Deltaproteobacteria bacterium]
MDILIGWQPYETEFKGARVTMELLPLKVDGYRFLMPYMKQFDETQKDEAAINSLEMQSGAISIFENNVKNITGLTVNGGPVTPELLSKEVKLSHLAADILGELVTRTIIEDEQIKNSERLSENSIQEPEIQNTSDSE